MSKYTPGQLFLLPCARELLLEQWHLASATEMRALSISSHWPEASQGQEPVLPRCYVRRVAEA